MSGAAKGARVMQQVKAMMTRWEKDGEAPDEARRPEEEFEGPSYKQKT